MYRFGLIKNKQITCPNCGYRKFSPYIDNNSGIALAKDLCGRCSRENNCGYHMPPRQLFLEYPEYIPDDTYTQEFEEIEEEKETTFLKIEDLDKTLFYQKNSLISFLNQYLSNEELIKAIENYFIGFTKDMIIFWQVDIDGRIRTGKKMLYKENGKRDKYHLYLMHREIYKREFVVKECYFGEHLISQFEEKDISIVESEKSALICSVVWPDQVWLSTGGKNKWLESSWPALQGRKITLIPDEDAIEEWEEMMIAMQMVELDVSIDKICEGKEGQSDIADLIIKQYRS